MAFYLSKIIWIVLNPFNLIIFLFLFATIANFFKYKKIFKYIFYPTLIFFLTISFFPIGKYLIYIIEKEYHNPPDIPPDVDGILILGGATNPLLSEQFNKTNFNDSADRLIHSIPLIKKNKKAKIIFSGGSGFINRPELDHAQHVKKFFISMNLNTDEIFFENKSKNTYENIIFSQQILKTNKNKKWLLITSAFHMKRAILIGEKNGWDFIAYPVDFKINKDFKFKPSLKLLSNINYFNSGSHEWLGLISYYLMGRTSKIF